MVGQESLKANIMSFVNGTKTYFQDHKMKNQKAQNAKSVWQLGQLGFKIDELFEVNTSGIKTHDDKGLGSFSKLSENNFKYHY